MERPQARAAPPPKQQQKPQGFKPGQRSPAAAVAVDWNGTKIGRVVSWDSRNWCGVVLCGNDEVCISTAAAAAAGLTNLMVDQPLEFRVRVGADGRREVEPGTLKTVRGRWPRALVPGLAAAGMGR